MPRASHHGSWPIAIEIKRALQYVCLPKVTQFSKKTYFWLLYQFVYFELYVPNINSQWFSTFFFWKEKSSYIFLLVLNHRYIIIFILLGYIIVPFYGDHDINFLRNTSSLLILVWGEQLQKPSIVYYKNWQNPMPGPGRVATLISPFWLFKMMMWLRWLSTLTIPHL